MSSPSKSKVILSLLTDQQEFQLMQAEDARQAAQRAGLTLEVLFSDNNAVLQIRQLMACINIAADARPVAIVLEPIGLSGLDNLAKTAIAAGIGWFLLGSHPPYIEKLLQENPQALLATVESDSREIGRIQARQIRALRPEGGRILCVEGPTTSMPARIRHEGLEEELKPFSKFHLEHTVAAGWTTASAEQVVSSWLRRGGSNAIRPDLIASQNDSMALGARAVFAAERPDWKEIPLLGCDGLPASGRRLVDTGVLAATVVKPPEAGTAITQFASAQQGNQLPRTTYLPVESYPALSRLSNKR